MLFPDSFGGDEVGERIHPLGADCGMDSLKGQASTVALAESKVALRPPSQNA